ncbi:MAG: hypothetical protein NTX03_01505 [Bacteroidetes bacterium]|nr:hypothetical protein [Bacteroidota bacterium]
MKKLLLILFVFIAAKGLGQGMQTEFGKNVVQYKDFMWLYYQEDNFDVYFYERGKELGRFVLENGKQYIKEIEKQIDFPVSDRITFIVYNSFTDYRQANFRIEEEMLNTGGKTSIQSTSAIIYFDGNHQHLISQIKEAVARIAITEMLSGGSLQEKVSNGVLLNLPKWYVDGLVKYLSGDWDAHDDIELKSGILSGRFKKFKHLTEEDKLTMGHSIWRYLDFVYGKEAVSNIIYNTRSSKNIDNGFLFVLGKTTEDVLDEWYKHYKYEFTEPGGPPPANAEELKIKRLFGKGKITTWDINRTATYAAVATNDRGKARVYLVNLSNGRKKLIWKQGYRRAGNQFDLQYPVISWSPVQDILSIFYEAQSQPYYVQYKLGKRKLTEKQLITSVDRVLSISYSADGRGVVASAIKQSQTDIYLFDFRTQFFRPLTDDIYDDLEPRFVNKGKGVVFSSNRPDKRVFKVNTNSNYSFNNSLDIFLFPDYLFSPKTLKRMSNSAFNETMPDAYDSTYISYLINENGVTNRNAAKLDSTFQYTQIIFRKTDTSKFKNDTLKILLKDISKIEFPDSLTHQNHLAKVDTQYIYQDTIYTYALTNYTEHLLSYSSRIKNNSLFELFEYGGKPHLFRKPMPMNILAATNSRKSPHSHHLEPESAKIIETDSTIKVNGNGSHLSNSNTDTIKYFKVEYPESPILSNQKENTKTTTNNLADIFSKPLAKKQKFALESLYELTFSPDFVITQLDNSIINSPYLPYKAGDEAFATNAINGMFKLGTSELFKDYRIMAGFRLNANIFNGAEYFISFEDYKKQLDKKLLFYRRGELKNPLGDNEFYRNTSHEGRYELKYPFSETFAVKGAGFLRMDKNTYLSTEKNYLNKKDEMDYWTGLKAELVYDNIIAKGTNLNSGSRAKLYSDFFYGLTKDNSLFYTIGGDLRNYTPIHRELIWANRVAFATSLGQAKVVYFLGGVENWLFPQYDKNNAVDPSQNYKYKMLATNMRGFAQNARNGNTFITYNSEIRLPVFRYFSGKPIHSAFKESFQVISFVDAGSAWNGLLPTGENNAYNIRTINNNPLTIKVITNRNPFVYSYGLGCRFMLLGYFFRLDRAYGIDEGEIKNKLWHFSVGLDF